MAKNNPTLKYNRSEFFDCYEHAPFRLRHNVSNHELLSIESLIELSKKLPNANIEYNSTNVGANSPDARTISFSEPVFEVIADIKNRDSWVGLKKIEQIPEYKALMDSLIDSAGIDAKNIVGELFNRECFVFVTSPNSMVPYHMDPEHNFLLQIAGEKHFTVFDAHNPNVLAERDIEKYYSSYRPENRKLVYDKSLDAYSKTIVLKPGDALHVPITFPHYVQTKDEVSVSLSITYSSRWSEDRETIYHLNHKLRSMHLSPIAYNRIVWIDKLKLFLLSALRKIRRLFG